MYGLFLLIVLICPQTTLATISSSFYSFIQTNFGQQVADQMARNDFGQRGSYGGGSHQGGTKTRNIPVIFVHGFLTTAGTTQPMATYFKQNYAYGDDELYATTFGRPAGSIPVQTALTCEYVKAIRNLIQTVSQYTSSQVNVIAYSMGGPISRKAIKGGRCVDTGEELGPSLTSLVNAYLGVAGAMKGAQSCTLPFGICNTLNGMSCGSQFLNDINSQTRYEGQRIYVLESSSDEVVGFNGCGGRPSEIVGADNTVILNGLKHIQVCSTLTANTQFNLITRGTQ
ncbi:Lipase EstA/Esterase EstB family-containing protein [Aphelenchoides besseyi]|nr:Lipase EstA/Esterase EstB family-containing protein [Aphelenchoides besseyi]